MPIIHVNLVEGRSKQQKLRLIEALTDAAESALSAPRASIRVLIHELPPEHWGIAGIPKSESPSSGR